MKRLPFHLFALALILITALLIRLHDLGKMPSGLFCDEASIGVNSNHILQNGTDEYGTPLPFFFRAFGEYKSPIQIYSTVPIIAVYGLKEWSVRLTSVFWGVLSIGALYLTILEVTKQSKYKKSVALFSALLLTLSPWHIHFSRVSLEGFMPFLFFTLMGLFFFLKSQLQKYFLIPSVIAFALSFYSYFPARIFIPLLGIALSYLYFRHLIKNLKVTVLSFFLLLILLMPFLKHLTSPVGLSRWYQVNIFNNPPKVGSIPAHIATNYFRHFGADFLFKKGDIDMPGQFITRHSVRGLGQLYWYQLPLLLLGIYYLFTIRDRRIAGILFAMLLIYPVGSMFTTDQSPQATRSIIGVLPFSIISALGILPLIEFTKSNKTIRAVFFILLSMVIMVSFLDFSTKYFKNYSNYAEDFWGWQFGPRDIIASLQNNQHSFDELFMNPEFNEPGIFLKFYAPYDCLNCFVGLPEDRLDQSKKQLFTLTPTYMQSHDEYNYLTRKILYYPNGKVAFILAEVSQK